MKYKLCFPYKSYICIFERFDEEVGLVNDMSTLIMSLGSKVFKSPFVVILPTPSSPPIMSGGTVKSSFTSVLPNIRVSITGIILVYPFQAVLSLTPDSEAQEEAFTKSIHAPYNFFVGSYL
jgi:hypothetical protein